MFSFSGLLLLFLIGITGLGIAMFVNLPDDWTLISAAVGIVAWFLAAILMWIDKTLGMIHHLKRSREIDKQFKIEMAKEKNQVIQRGPSSAKKRATSKRLKLWMNTILGNRD